MKFLYVAGERQAAEQAGLALRSVGQDVRVAWAAGAGQARRWIDENRNATALIIEVGSDTRPFEALVTHARGIGVKVPVIGVPLNDTRELLMSVRAVADEVVPRDAAFFVELPRAVNRTLFPRQAHVESISLPPYDEPLQQQLRDTEAAAARAEQRAQEALTQLRAREETLQAAIEQERALRLRDTATFADALSRRDKELADASAAQRTLTENLNRTQSELERLRRDLTTAIVKAEESERQSALNGDRADSAQQLEQELVEARRILRLADELHATTKAEAEARIRDIQQQTAARLAEAAGVASAVQRELADTVAALRRVEDTSSAQQAALARQLAEQQAAHEAVVRHAAAEKQDLETRLAAAARARRDLEEEHASALAEARGASAAADQRARMQQADADAARRVLEARLADSAAAADRLRAALSDRELALANLQQQAEAERHAAGEQLASQQATFDAAVAREASRYQVAAAQLAQRELEHRNVVEALEAARRDLEARLTAADDARRHLEEQHESALAAARAAMETAAQRASSQHAEATRFAEALQSRLDESLATIERLRAELSGRESALTEAHSQAAAERQEARQQQVDAAAHARSLESKLADAVAETQRLRAELSETTLALTSARQQAASDREAAAEQTKQREAEFDAIVAKEAAARKALETRLAEHQQQAESRATQAASALAALQAKLVEQAAALLEVERQANADRHEAVEQAARRQAQFDTALAEEVGRRESVASKLVEAETALQKAGADHAAAIAVAREQLAHQQRAAESRDAELRRALEALETRLADSAAALQRAEAQAAGDRRAAAERAAAQQAEFETAIAHEVARTQAAVEKLAEHDTARQAAQEQYQSELESWQRRLAETQEQAAAQATEAAAHAAALERQLADSAAALKRAYEQASRERQAAAQQTAALRAQFETALAQEVASRQAVETKLFEEQGARQQAEAQHTTDLATARDEFARYRQVADARMAESMANAAATLEASLQKAAAERKAAADRFAEQQATLETALAQEVARREAADTALAALQIASAEAERRFVDGIAAMRQQAAEHDARLRERAASDRSQWEATLSERQQRISQLESDVTRAAQSIAAGQTRNEQLETANADLRSRLAALEQTLEQARAAAQQSLDELSREHTAERSRLQALIDERDRRLVDESTRYQAAHEAAAKAIADVERRLRTAMETGQRDTNKIQQLEAQAAALGRDVEGLARQRDALQKEAERVPAMQKLIDDTQADHRLRFERTPVAMWRSRPDGAIVEANHALVSLLRYKTADELLKVDFSATVFESGDELQWLVDRCLASRNTESVETTWRRKDGVGLVVRLTAIAAAPDAVDFVATDITALRAVEEKLRNAQRMESVARYASEVAATCNKLLGQVNQQGQQWLTNIQGDSARHRGELLLDDVTRAAGFLNQLVVYGKEQKNAPELVEVKQVLRDLEPILKRVAGGHVQLVMPRTSSPYNLDVEMERFERILVNVAAYGRERMPHGGRLVMDVKPVVVDRAFVAKYPNVRPGAHVLLSVTEEKEAASPDWSATLRDQAPGGNGGTSSTPKPGVDLAALQALVSDCGGHLWILAEPSGNMQLRIHLPRRVLDDRAPAAKSGRGRWMSKLAGVRNREAV